jgi:hypothetical protein
LANGMYATVGGGFNNAASVYAAAVGGGYDNIASAALATVSGGWCNTANGRSATVGGGESNTAGNSYATVCGGEGNAANGGRATVAGGKWNAANGTYAVVPGGYKCSAGGDYSLAAGNRARTTGIGTFVWGDSTLADFDYNVTNGFGVRASGGVTFYTNSALTTGVTVAAGSGTWGSASDRNAKDEIKPVDAKEVLDKVVNLPVATWKYKTEQGARHMGPMAKDLYAAFGLGDSDKSITTIDADGVALAAIQGLNQRLQEKDAQIQHQKTELEEMKTRLAALEALVQKSFRK